MSSPPDLLVPWRAARHSLRARILTGVLAISIIGALAAALTAYAAARAQLLGQLTDRLDGISAGQAGEIDRWVEALTEDLVFASGLPSMRRSAADLVSGADSAGVRGRLTMLLTGAHTSGPRFQEVFLLDARDARVLASTDSTRVGTYELVSEYWQKGRDAPYVQEVYPSPTDGTPALTVAAPVRDPESGDVIAVLAGHLDLRHLENLFADRPGITSEAETYLVSQVGNFVSAERFGRAGILRGPRSEGIQRALRGEEGVARYRNYRGEPVLGAYRWLDQRRMALLIEVPEASALAPARRLGFMTLGVTMILVLALGVASASLAGRVVSPLVALSGAAQRVARGDFQARVPEDGEDEVAHLAHSFNEMTQRLEGVYGDLRDQIEDTRRAYRAMAQGRALLDAIVDHAPSLITVSDRAGVLHLVNARFATLFGDGSPLLDRALVDILPPETAEAIMAAEQTVLEENRVVETSFTVPSPSGSLHFFAVAFPLEESALYAGEVGLIALDRTDRVLADKARTELEAQVQQMQRVESLGLLAGGIAHDFNNLLQAILGHAALAADTGSVEEMRRYLEQVQSAAARGADLTSQLLAYAGRRSVEAQVVDVNQVVRDLAELIAVSVPKSATLRTELCPRPLPVSADGSQIAQVVMNLLSNAVDALPEARGEVHVGTRYQRLGTPRSVGAPPVVSAPDGEYATLSVRDTGVGMDADTLSHMFDPFFTTKEHGHGLGLAAVVGIVRAADGHMSVDSQPGEGTTFTIYLPLSPVAQEPEPERRSVAGDGSLEGRTFLVADDEDVVRRFVVQVLGRLGAIVLEARDGQEAVDVFDAHAGAVDGAVLDLSMPRLGGVEVHRHIRTTDPRVPVILASGFDVAGTLGDVQDDPHVDVLQKPYRPSDLVARLKEMLERRA